MGLFNEESRAFARKFMENPGQVGSLVPSSARLARAMAGEIDWGKARAVAELGSGTGAITREIARRREPGTSIYLFEKDAEMRRRLRERYPDFRCFSDAAGMADTLRRDGSGGLDAIVSGLPFFNFPQPLRDRLLAQIVDSLKPGGLFVAFQYSLQMRGQLARRLEIRRIRFVPLNLPPAFVYVCRKRDDGDE